MFIIGDMWMSFGSTQEAEIMETHIGKVPSEIREENELCNRNSFKNR